MFSEVQCPVCQLYLLQGMTLESHLETHPKESVISALVSATVSKWGATEESSALVKHGRSLGMPQSNVMIVNSRSTQLIRQTTTHQPVASGSGPYMTNLVPAQMISAAPAPTPWPYCVLMKQQYPPNDLMPVPQASVTEMAYGEEEEDPPAAEEPYYLSEGQESAIDASQEEDEAQDEEEVAYPEEYSATDEVEIIESKDEVSKTVPEKKTEEDKTTKYCPNGFRVLSDVILSPKDTFKMQDIIYQQSKVKQDSGKVNSCSEIAEESKREVARPASVIRMVTSASVPLPMMIKVEEEKVEKPEEIKETPKEEVKEPVSLPTKSTTFPMIAPRKFLNKTPKKLVVKFKNPIVIHDTPDEVKIEAPREVEINKVPVDVPSTSKTAVTILATDNEEPVEEKEPPKEVGVKEMEVESNNDDVEIIEEPKGNEKCADAETTNTSVMDVETEKAEHEVKKEEDNQEDVIIVEDNEEEAEKPNESIKVCENVEEEEEEEEPKSCLAEVHAEPKKESMKMEVEAEMKSDVITPPESEVFTIIQMDAEEKEEKLFAASCSSSSSSSSAGTSASSSSSSSSSGGSSNRAEFTAPNSQEFMEETAGPSRFDYGFTEFLAYNESEGEIFSNDRSVRFSPMGIMNEDLSWEQYTQLESNQNSYVDLDTCRTHSMGVSRAPSADSLNIRTDEKMPAKGEISEQESNGDIDGLWNIPVYPNSDTGPRFSSSYDMSVARESWSLSSDQNNQPDASHIQTHVIPKFTSLASENHEDQKLLVPLLGDLDSSSGFKKNDGKNKKPLLRLLKYPCSMCSRSFRLYRQRKYHMLNDHQVFLTAEKRSKKLATKVKTEPPSSTSTTGASLSLSEDDKATSYPTSTFFIDFNIKQMKDKQTFTSDVQNLVTMFNTKRFYFCMTCKGQFSKIRDYDKHLSIHPAECYSCGKVFKSWKTLLNHLKRHLGMNEYVCRTCDKQFSSRQSMAEHERMHTGEMPIKCSLCPRMFRRQSNLLQHQHNHHMKIRTRIKDYLCHCGEVFHTKAKFLWHKETHEKIPKGCPFCRERFIHRNSLSRHIRLAHAEKFIEIKKETVACHICHKHYLKTSIKTHLMIHTEQVHFECSICNKSFSTKWNLKMHKWIHASRTAMPFKCPTCPKAFIRQNDLQDHLNRHKSIKPFTCDYCGCQFGRKYNWLRHTREHITEKQHVCTICGKSFHRAYYLKEHSRSHTNERPYECIICGKTSATKTNHNKHVKIHHARDPLTAEG
ncbi:uncharacterized protein LOC132258380 [Phlebotomus argentipes]|uniref:uncharacterized protein LOC132258380 n=1 Tax=Phlebotomus argentipes TaxID=94469 RepID=UPI002893498E|nr:uncharacterized protein LOC132258380 [Phlebotomus argentipes]